MGGNCGHLRHALLQGYDSRFIDAHRVSDSACGASRCNQFGQIPFYNTISGNQHDSHPDTAMVSVAIDAAERPVDIYVAHRSR
jgi:hypothetical protein